MIKLIPLRVGRTRPTPPPASPRGAGPPTHGPPKCTSLCTRAWYRRSVNVDGPLRHLKERGFSVSGLAHAHRLDPTHLHNAVRGRTRMTYDEMRALIESLDMPITEVLSDRMLERALGR